MPDIRVFRRAQQYVKALNRRSQVVVKRAGSRSDLFTAPEDGPGQHTRIVLENLLEDLVFALQDLADENLCKERWGSESDEAQVRRLIQGMIHEVVPAIFRHEGGSPRDPAQRRQLMEALNLSEEK